MFDSETCHFRSASSPELELSLKLLEKGFDVEEICKFVGWRGFEEMVEYILRHYGYSTFKHFRFGCTGRRYEVDIIALRRPIMLSVECKRWRKSWQASSIRRVVEAHQVRTWHLSECLADYRSSLAIQGWDHVVLYPVLLMMGETPSRIEKGIPVVPIHRVRDFLDGFELHLHEFVAYHFHV
ncbi:MAG: restriction endonuclease [Candidatus Bathyarchaeia archaeon]